MEKYDVVIIGAGYIGCSIAYKISCENLKVLLLDKGEIGAGASGGNSGCIQVQDASPGLSYELTRYGFDRVMHLREEIGPQMDIDYYPSILAARSEDELEQLITLYEQKREMGLDLELIGISEMKKREPNINEKAFLGGTYYMQGRTYPFSFLYGLVRKAKEQGLEVREYTPVQDIIETNCGTDGREKESRIVGVRLSNGDEIHCRHLVLATGAWTKELGAKVGLNLPVEALRGEALVTEAIGPFLNSHFSPVSFFSVKHSENRSSFSLCIDQTEHGNILIGETRRKLTIPIDDNKDLVTSWEHLKHVRREAVTCFPALRNVNILRSWTVASPYTETLIPLLGPVGKKGLLVAAGFKSSIVMSAVAAEIIRDFVIEGCTRWDLSEYNNRGDRRTR